MPRDGSHIGYSLFPSVCSDSCFVEILTRSVSSIIRRTVKVSGQNRSEINTIIFLFQSFFTCSESMRCKQLPEITTKTISYGNFRKSISKLRETVQTQGTFFPPFHSTSNFKCFV